MKYDKISEAILVLNCQSLDESAFRELVNRWEPILYYYLRRIVGNEDAVWDILQETWLAVFQSIHKLRDTRKFPAWLYQISHNKAIGFLRKQNKYVQIMKEQMADDCENNFSISIVEDQVEFVHELLGKLKLVHREVLTLYFLEEFSIKEVAYIIGVSEGTVKSRLHYAKNRLHEALERTNDV
ncbi:MAG: RNA polymerase sigma factor [Planctomycetes bacterium]|nr:RNA polymerase sigma factor [Planctomycetota bacterium]